MNGLRFSSADRERLCRKLAQFGSPGTESEDTLMKKKRIIGKTVAVTTACLLLTGATALASTGASSQICWSKGGYDYATTEEMASAQKDIQGEGQSPMAPFPERFDNGYAFAGGTLIHGTEADKSNSDPWEDLSGSYKNDSGQEVTLDMSYQPYESDRTDTEERTVDGVLLHYNEDEYLFLPPDQEGKLDEETEKRMNTDEHFFVSFGSKTPETDLYRSVAFEWDGVTYTLYSMSGARGEELLTMAEELLHTLH